MLRSGEGVSLPDADGRIARLRIGEGIGEGIEIEFEGMAKKVRLGPEGYDREETPRVLEYLYTNQPISLIWGALVWIWGLLWSSRALLG